MNNTNTAQGAGTTLLVLVVDRSGSMQSIRSDMEGGIKRLLEDQRREPGKCFVTLAQFDTEFDLLWNAVPVAEVTAYELVPRGSTALLDAIGRTIGYVQDYLDKLPLHHKPDHVIFAVVTDGLENSSREWSRAKVMAAVKDRSDAGWHFTFLGANQDAIQEGAQVGVAAHAAMTYAPVPGAVAGAMSSLSASVKRVRRGAGSALTYTDQERKAASGD